VIKESALWVSEKKMALNTSMECERARKADRDGKANFLRGQ